MVEIRSTLTDYEGDCLFLRPFGNHFDLSVWNSEKFSYIALSTADLTRLAAAIATLTGTETEAVRLLRELMDAVLYERYAERSKMKGASIVRTNKAFSAASAFLTRQDGPSTTS